jgi:hypothetical protein
VSFLARRRSDARQPGVWLREFRRATPREKRQDLIDGLDLDTAFAALTHEAPAVRECRYPLIVYILAARALQEPATPATGAARQDLLKRVAVLFGLKPTAMLRDLHAMMRQLRHDHEKWCRRHTPATATGQSS